MFIDQKMENAQTIANARGNYKYFRKMKTKE